MDITKVTVKKVPSTVGMGIMVVINTRTKVQITMVVVTMLVVVILNMGIHRMVNMVVEIQAYQQQVAIIGIGNEYGHHGSNYSKYGSKNGGANFTLPGQNRSNKFVLNQPLSKMKNKSSSNYKNYGNNYNLGQRRRGGPDPMSQNDHSVNKIFAVFAKGIESWSKW